MSFIFDAKNKINIYISPKEKESLFFAANDFLKDLQTIFGKASFTNNTEDASITIESKEFAHNEEYCYEITKDKIYITGNDDLGTIYALFSFLENELLVPPFYKIEGLKLKHIDRLELKEKKVSSFPSTKYRGIFINDEDLLTSFKFKGKRLIDYQFYNNVISEEMIDIIAETLLRYKMNLIIPSTLVDITNPPEKLLLDVCSRRGLYISQHHIEPLGLSKFGFEKFAKENNLNPTFSYISNKETLLHCWEKYAEAWSKYPRVIWQLGLRGGYDRPVWTLEKNIGDSNKERGKLISSAIFDQYNLIKKVYKYPLITTSTLWMEGASLLESGDLPLPKDAIIVFADVGMSSMFGEDFFKVKREQDRKYGVYYHAAYVHMGPHLAEGLIPEKMKYSYDLAKEYKTDFYSIINVANLKEMTLSLYLNSKITWNNSASIDELINQYSKLYFGDNRLSKLIKDYYSSLLNIGDKEYTYFCQKYDFSEHKYSDLKFPLVNINDGIIKSMIWNIPVNEKMLHFSSEFKESFKIGASKMNEVYSKFLDISNELPIEYKNGFCQHFVHQSFYMKEMLNEGYHYILAYEAKENNDHESFVRNMNISISCLDNILNNRYKYYFGEWANYFDGDDKIDIKRIKQSLIEELNNN